MCQNDNYYLFYVLNRQHAGGWPCYNLFEQITGGMAYVRTEFT